MNTAQITYAVLLAIVFAWRGPSYGLWVLLGNLLATLAICLGMDLGAVGRSDATVYMMIVDAASGAALVIRPGLARVASVGYALTVPIYSAVILFGVSPDTTFAVIYVVLFAQLGVFAVGGNGGNGFSSRHRLHHRFHHPAQSLRTQSMARGSVSEVSGNDRGGK